MSKRVRKELSDWEEWVRPYVKKHSFKRRANQYSSNLVESYCFSVDQVPFGEMIKHSVPKYLKWLVSGDCLRCGSHFIVNWNNLWIRKAFKGQEVCGACGRKEQFTEEWRSKNSEAQKKVQGTVEARKRMSGILKASWDGDPERKKRVSQTLLQTYKNNPELRKKIGDAARRNWGRPEYQERVTGHGYHHGVFLSRCGKVFFASSWELMFLDWCEKCSNVKTFQRCNDRIPYEKPGGARARYLPDFEIEIDGEVVIVEVKGMRNLELVERKKVAAEKFYGGRKGYMIIYRDDLKRLGVFRQNKKIPVWIENLELEGKVESHGFGKKH